MDKMDDLNEITEQQTDEANVDDALNDAKKAEQDFDKERQRADQAEANLRKTKVEQEQLQQKLAEQKASAEQLAKQIDELKAAKGASDEVESLLGDFDPENASLEDYGTALKQIGGMVRDLKSELASVRSRAEQTAEETESERQQRQAEDAKAKTYNRVCTRLEKKYGDGLRNRATELFQEKVKLEGPPSDPADATLRLDECFAEAKEEAAKAKKKDAESTKKVTTDTGGGGVRPSYGDVQIKPGSLDDVAAQFETATAP